MNKFLLQNERMHFSSPNINVCYRVIIEGVLDKMKIEDAFQKMSIRHPFLRCSLEIDGQNNAWLVEKHSSLCIEHLNSDEMDWKTWYHNADNEPFDFQNEPLLKICVINGENTEIVILGHHVIGDGIGYLNLVKDILLALDDQFDDLPLIPPTKPEDRYFKETFLLDQPTKDFAQWLNNEWKKSSISFTKNDFQTFFENYRKDFIPGLYMFFLEDSDFDLLINKSKSNNLSVNEIVASAFTLAILEILNKKEIRLGVATNIRSELVSEPVSCMGNFVSGIAETVCYNFDSDFLSNAKIIAEKLREKLLNKKERHLAVHFLNEFDKDLLESIMYAAYGNFEHPASKKLAELLGEQLENKGIGISNLGRHDFKNYKNISVVDLQFIGPVFPANLITVDVLTVNGKLNFCIRFNHNEIAIESIISTCKRVFALLIS